MSGIKQATSGEAQLMSGFLPGQQKMPTEYNLFLDK